MEDNIRSSSKKKPLISVVIPVYNVESYLRRCLDTVLAQTYQNIEIIIVDDGSTDSSGRICREYASKDSRIVVIRQENGGLSSARNTGIHYAHGRFITFIDSDDTVQKDMIVYLYHLISIFKCSMSLCCLTTVFTASGKIKKSGNGQECRINAHDAIESMLYHGFVDTSACAKLYDISLFATIRFPERKLFEDIGTTYKLFIKSGYIACGFKNKYNYFVRQNSIVTRTFSKEKLDLLEMTDTMANRVLDLYPDLKKAVLRRQVYARFSTLNQMITHGGWHAFPGQRMSMITYIKKYGKHLLYDPKVPNRDKMAILALLISPSFYVFLWKLYKKYSS